MQTSLLQKNNVMYVGTANGSDLCLCAVLVLCLPFSSLYFSVSWWQIGNPLIVNFKEGGPLACGVSDTSFFILQMNY